MRWPAVGSRTLWIFACITGVALVSGAAASVYTGNAIWVAIATQVLVIALVVVFARSAYNVEKLRGVSAQAPAVQYRPGEPLDMLRRDIQRDVSALLALHATVTIDGAVPAPGGWAATPDTLLALVSRIVAAKSIRTVVECGSGTSTVWIALALRQRAEGKVISLEHDPRYAAATQRAVDALGLTSFVEIRVLPLVGCTIDGAVYQWFDPAAFEDIDSVSLLFVDGPPGHVGRHARFPAVPLLASKLTRDAWIVLDDIDRVDEQEVQELWTSRDWAGKRFECVSTTDRAAILETSRSGRV